MHPRCSRRLAQVPRLPYTYGTSSDSCPRSFYPRLFTELRNASILRCTWITNCEGGVHPRRGRSPENFTVLSANLKLVNRRVEEPARFCTMLLKTFLLSRGTLTIFLSSRIDPGRKFFENLEKRTKYQESLILYAIISVLRFLKYKRIL